MNRTFWFLPALFGVLLAPTAAWEANSSRNFGINVTKSTETLGLSPTSLTFASQNTGTSSTAQAITATSTGTGAFPLSSVAISGTNASSFSQTNNCPSSLAANATCTINVVFTPTATGALTASAVVSQTGGGTYTVALSGTGTTPPPPPTSAFYVATTGKDSNAGTLAAPFATLTKCQSAMQGSSTVKTCYIRAGTYKPASAGNGCGFSNGAALILTSSDNGETWSYYPSDGYDTAIINGQASGNSGLGFGFCVNANNVTINGLYFENFQISGINITGSNIVVENNIIYNITNTANATYCIGTNNAPSSQIIHNYVSNCTDMGIGSWPTSANGTNNLLIAYNYVTNACSAVADCGGIYMENNNGEPETGEIVEYNYITNVSGAGGGEPVYIDDQTSNITVTGNVMAGSAWQCFYVHGGTSNVATGNICDLGTNGSMGPVSAQYESPTTMAGNTWTNNLVVAAISGSNVGAGYNCNSGPCQMTIGPNAYFNYTGSSVGTSGSLGSDSKPVNANPNFTCGWEYTLPSNSPVYTSPPGFPTQPAGWGTAGFWGPPGFVIPQSGTAPSPPHSC
jgi:hypothetical protein